MIMIKIQKKEKSKKIMKKKQHKKGKFERSNLQATQREKNRKK